MTTKRNRPARVAAAFLAGAVFVGACGSSAKSDGANTNGEPTATGVFTMPAVDVLDVATGGKVPFAKLNPSDKPLLLWFWAPH